MPQQILEDLDLEYEFNEPNTPISYVIDKIHSRLLKSNLRNSIIRAAQNLDENPMETLNMIFSDSANLLRKVSKSDRTLDSKNTQLVLDRYKKRLSDTADSKLTYGFDEIDAHLGGLRKGELYFVVARPKRCKSWMLVKSALGSWLNGHNVCFMTLEMSPEEIQDRFLCMLAGVSWTRFQHQSLTDPEINILEKAYQWMSEQPNIIQFIRPERGKRSVPHMQQMALQGQAQVLYIDQLSWIESSSRTSADRWLQVGYICEELKECAIDMPVYVAAQFNREASKSTSIWDLNLSKIGLSDIIGQMADIVLGIFANTSMMHNNIMQFGVIDSRSFSPVAWDIVVELGLNSNFRVIDQISPDD
ncbi:MAG: DnaB-like helicase C-terminal domain-containing protein [Nitrososphaerales archaeon]